MRGMCVSGGTWRRGCEMTRLERSPFHDPTKRAQDKMASLLGVSVFPAAEWGPCGDRREKSWHMIANFLPEKTARPFQRSLLENSGS